MGQSDKYIDGLQQVYKQETNVNRSLEDTDMGMKHNFEGIPDDINNSRNDPEGDELAKSMSKDYVSNLLSGSRLDSPDDKHERRISQYEQENFNQVMVFSESGMSPSPVLDKEPVWRYSEQNPEVPEVEN